MCICSSAAADDSGLGLRPRTLDWGGAMNLLQVEGGATLAFEDLVSAQPGNFTAGEEVRVCKATCLRWHACTVSPPGGS